MVKPVVEGADLKWGRGKGIAPSVLRPTSSSSGFGWHQVEWTVWSVRASSIGYFYWHIKFIETKKFVRVPL